MSNTACTNGSSRRARPRRAAARDGRGERAHLRHVDGIDGSRRERRVAAHALPIGHQPVERRAGVVPVPHEVQQPPSRLGCAVHVGDRVDEDVALGDHLIDECVGERDEGRTRPSALRAPCPAKPHTRRMRASRRATAADEPTSRSRPRTRGVRRRSKGQHRRSPPAPGRPPRRSQTHPHPGGSAPPRTPQGASGRSCASPSSGTAVAARARSSREHRDSAPSTWRS